MLKVIHGRPHSSTLLSRGEGGGQAVEGDGLAAQGACAEDDGEHDLQFVQHLVEGHPGARAYLYRLGTASGSSSGSSISGLETNATV